jgi:hypothetical protein
MLKSKRFLKARCPPALHPQIDQAFPTKVSPTQALIVFAILGFLLHWFIGVFLACVIGSIFYCLRMTQRGRIVVREVSSRLTKVCRTNVGEGKTLCLLLLIGYVLFTRVVSPAIFGANHPRHAGSNSLDVSDPVAEAYHLGFDDALAGRQRDPPADESGAYYANTLAPKRASLLSMGNIFRMLILGQMILSLGGGIHAWNLQMCLHGLRNMSYWNMFMIYNLISGLLW